MIFQFGVFETTIWFFFIRMLILSFSFFSSTVTQAYIHICTQWLPQMHVTHVHESSYKQNTAEFASVKQILRNSTAASYGMNMKKKQYTHTHTHTHWRTYDQLYQWHPFYCMHAVFLHGLIHSTHQFRMRQKPYFSHSNMIFLSCHSKYQMQKFRLMNLFPWWPLAKCHLAFYLHYISSEKLLLIECMASLANTINSILFFPLYSMWEIKRINHSMKSTSDSNNTALIHIFLSVYWITMKVKPSKLWTVYAFFFINLIQIMGYVLVQILYNTHINVCHHHQWQQQNSESRYLDQLNIYYMIINKYLF